jgi:polyphosphate kinase 2 (PPK2 family)
MPYDQSSPPTIKEMEQRLAVLQQQVKASGVPVIILFEGLSATGKGQAISSLILNFDPRGYDVYATRVPEKHEKRKPWLSRFAEKIPARGRIAVFDRSWYSGCTT